MRWTGGVLRDQFVLVPTRDVYCFYPWRRARRGTLSVAVVNDTERVTYLASFHLDHQPSTNECARHLNICEKPVLSLSKDSWMVSAWKPALGGDIFATKTRSNGGIIPGEVSHDYCHFRRKTIQGSA